MVLQSTGVISLANIQTEFGGANPIRLSEYYLNGVYTTGTGTVGIPTSGQITLKSFYGKSKVIEYMLAGNRGGNMSETGGTRLGGITGVDDGFANIGTVFPFFWFGIDWGSGNNIQWCTNNVMTFGGGSTNFSAWSPGTGKGVLMGQYDRRTNYATEFAPYTSNGYNIKRFIVNQRNYYSTVGSEIQMEIRLIRGPAYQYIEIRMANWTAGTGGIWNISNGTSFYNPFSGAPPVGTGASVVLRGDLSGNNWVAYNNYYVNL